MNEMQELNVMMQEMLSRFDTIDKRLATLEEKIDHNTTVLNAVVHSLEVTNAKLDGMEIRLSTMQGDVKGIKETLDAHSSLHGKHITAIEVIKNKLQ